MSSKMPPLRIHVAMLNSLRAIEMMGGGNLLVTRIEGKYSRTIGEAQEILCHSETCQAFRRLTEMYDVRWKAKGDGEAKSVSTILKEVQNDGCPEVFLKTLTIIKPYVEYNEHLLQNIEGYKPFVFHPHPFKPSVFNRLKGRMPSFRLYARMREIRKILAADLDDETRKRWRDILLINYPHESLSNQEIRHLWANEPCCILLKESKGKFTFMEVDESREA